MRVLVDGIPRRKGGIGSLLMNYAMINANEVSVDPIQFDYLISERSDYQQELEMLGSECFVVPSITHVAEYRKAIKAIFEKHHYDFLWLNNTSKINRFLPLHAKRKGAKIITHPHGVAGEEKGLKRQIFRVLNALNYRAYMRVMDIPLACSEQAAQMYYRDLSIVRKTTVINNGILTERYRFSGEARQRIREQLSIGDEQIVLGTVGRLSSVKNHEFMISLLTCLPENYCCVVLGGGEDEMKLLQSAQEKGVQNRFLLPGSVENVSDYLCAFDVFLLPSLHEGMPFAVIEAQASGLPCIVSHTVSHEVKLSDLVQFGTLNDLEDWTLRICDLEYNIAQRAAFADVIKQQGFSVEDSYATFVRQLNAK